MTSNILEKLMEILMGTMAIVGTLLLCGLLVGAIVLTYNNFYGEEKRCVVFGPEIVKSGFMYVGKIYVPTTYKTRECLSYE